MPILKVNNVINETLLQQFHWLKKQDCKNQIIKNFEGKIRQGKNKKSKPC